MKLNVNTDGVIITAKQKALIERKILKMKKYLHDEPITVDVLLQDESSPEKGGIDQKISLNATFGKEKIFIEEKSDRLMRAFAVAQKRFERQLRDFNNKRIDKVHRGGGMRFEKLMGILKKVKRPKFKRNRQEEEI